MSRIVVLNHVTLDGVMQAPGRLEEDTRGGFPYGGWGALHADDVMRKKTFEDRGDGAGLLLGRRSYEEMLSYWNEQGGPFKDALNNAPKYVASTTLREPLSWPNSMLLSDDVPGAVERLKKELEGDLLVMGSGNLLQTLMHHDLIDEYMLVIHPLVFGTGTRLFGEGSPKISLRLVECTPTPRGVLIATYEPER